MLILAGDIGGTNTRLAIFQNSTTQKLEAIAEQVYPSGDYGSLNEIIDQFLQSQRLTVSLSCFGIAGPIIKQSCQATNLPWTIHAQEITERFSLQHTWLLNDLEANAWGIGALGVGDFHILNPGDPQRGGNASIISAGTGLGEAGLYWDGEMHRPFPSEGGHTDFSPGNALEFALMDYLARDYGRVSWERVVSGPGLLAIHDFLRERLDTAVPDWLVQEMESKGGPRAISEAAIQAQDPVCVQALDLFIELYGREAGNHALKLMATGGVYLGGGIAPKILSRLTAGGFMHGFSNKGRMRPLVEAMPVKIILNDKAALLGAARYASLAAEAQ